MNVSTESIQMELWQPTLNRSPGKQKLPPKPMDSFARKVRKVLKRHGLLRRRLAETVVDALSKNKYQLRRLDELMHSAALEINNDIVDHQLNI